MTDRTCQSCAYYLKRTEIRKKLFGGKHEFVNHLCMRLGTNGEPAYTVRASEYSYTGVMINPSQVAGLCGPLGKLWEKKND